MTALLHFADFPVGRQFPLGPVEVTAEAIRDFASEFDPQPFHLDDEVGKASILGGLAASGWHTMALAFRMMCDRFLLNTAGMGSNGLDHVKWLKPVLAGDVLQGYFEVISARHSASKPELGIVEFRAVLQNQLAIASIEIQGRFFVKTGAA